MPSQWSQPSVTSILTCGAHISLSCWGAHHKQDSCLCFFLHWMTLVQVCHGFHAVRGAVIHPFFKLYSSPLFEYSTYLSISHWTSGLYIFGSTEQYRCDYPCTCILVSRTHLLVVNTIVFAGTPSQIYTFRFSCQIVERSYIPSVLFVCLDLQPLVLSLLLL